MTRILHIHLLGDFRLIYGDTSLTTVSTLRLQSLLAYLVLQRHAPQSRHHLAFLLWPDTPETQAHTNFRTLLHRLRQALPEAESFLQVEAQTVQWRPEAPFILDVADFEQTLRQTNSVTTLQKATDLYRGDLLPGCYDDWILPHRERLRQTFNQALEQLLIRLEHERNYAAAIQTAQRLLRYDSLHEATYRRLMRLHALNGDRVGVQRVYQDCLATLRRELDVPPSPATRQAYERLAHLDTPITQRHNLPVQLIPFVGREEELAQLAQLLANPACRLLTLLGPGGIGKTRLAIRAARAQIGLYLHGVYLVSLAATLSADFLVSALADALNFSFHGPEDPKIQLLNYLREKELLLVLDNFEHLLPPAEAGKPGGAGLLVEILTNAPEVKILVTSRERLNLPGEWLFEVGGLSTPLPVSPLTGEAGATKLESYSAVALFLQAARRVQPGFLLTPETQADVAQLCRLVEGMPLALELAAGWVRSLSCAEIVRELEQDLSFLATSHRHLIERHQSMQAVFDHSWRLLPAEERRVWRQLSVFQGGFRREAAEQVTGASLRLLSALVDKSLLRREPSGRYDLHELLRQYAAARLAEEPEEQEAARARHGRYYLEFLQRQTQPLLGSQQKQALAEVKAKLGNLRAAWQWAIDNKKVADMGQAIESLSFLHSSQGWFHEGERLFRQAAESLAGPGEQGHTLLRGQMLQQQGTFLFHLGRFSQSTEALQDSLTLLRRVEAGVEIAGDLHFLGGIAWLRGDHEKAQSLMQESLAIYEESHSRPGIGIVLCLGSLGLIFQTRGDYEEANRLMQQGLLIAKETGNQRMIAMSLSFTGNLASLRGRYREAKKLLRESLTLSREINDQWNTAVCLNHLGALIALSGTGEWAEAKRLHQESLTVAKEVGDPWNIAMALNHLSQTSLRLAEYQEARQYSLTALRTAMSAQLTPLALDILAGWAAWLVAQDANEAGQPTKPVTSAAAEQSLELLALVLNHPATTWETKDKATRLLAELESQLPPPVSAAARARGQTCSLEAVVAEILAEM